MENNNINKFSSTPKFIQQTIMSFCDTKELLNLRLVDKKIGKNATEVLEKKIKSEHVNVSDQFKANVVEKKIKALIPKEGVGYVLGYLSEGSVGKIFGDTSSSILPSELSEIEDIDNTHFVLWYNNGMSSTQIKQDYQKRMLFLAIKELAFAACEGKAAQRYKNSGDLNRPGFQFKQFEILPSDLECPIGKSVEKAKRFCTIL